MATFTSNTPLNIGDYTVTTSNLAVSGISNISDLNVSLNVSHTWNSDLRVFVISPSGKQVELFSEVGIGGQGFLNTTFDDEAGSSITAGSGTFSGTYKPEGKLSDFDGLNANGTWKLKIIDAAEGDTGRLNSWSLIVNGSAGTTPPPPPIDNLTKTGTSGNDTLTGGSGGKYTLIGGKGDDTYIVDTDDVITEITAEGIDTISTSVSYVMSDNYVNNLTLTGSSTINGTGNSYNNVVTGNSADNVLNGGAGIDTLMGGLGDETYIVDSTTDVIIEQPGEGTETIASSVSYVMSDNYINNLTLTGSSALNGTGNSYNNVITGNSPNNILVGGLGDDTLIGGGGSDRFRFTARNTGVDVIDDFSVSGGDRIEISKTGFGASSVSQFKYNSATGDLSFNSTVFAELDTGLGFQPTQHLVLI